MIIDTDVLIWYMRGDAAALDVIKSTEKISLSVISYMELVQGMHNKRELNVLRKTFSRWRASIVYVNESISVKAMLYVEQHFLGGSLKLADALIAATAVHYNEQLLTGNDRHFNMVSELGLEVFRPDSNS